MGRKRIVRETPAEVSPQEEFNYVDTDAAEAAEGRKPLRGETEKAVIIDEAAATLAERKPHTKQDLLKKKDGRIVVNRKAYGKDDVEEELIDVPYFEVEPAYVSSSVGLTKNLGNYESLRLEVYASLPVLPDTSEMERGFEIVANLIEERLVKNLENFGD